MLNRIALRVLALAAMAAAFAAAGLTAYFGVLKPARSDAPAVKVAMTPERIARGKYLFTLADCDGCHTLRDWSRFGAPPIETSRGRGFAMPPEMGMPGAIVAPNITPDPETGIGRWTDGEKIRAIREGIRRDGSPLFPMMPYQFLRHMSDEDVQSLVAYLNTLAPIRNPLPRSAVDFPVSVLIRTAPQPAGSVPAPPRGDRLAYGRYLVAVAGCAECHTPAEKGRMDESRLFAGGHEFRLPGTRVISANITPDADTGLGTWSEQEFLNRFYQYQEYVKNGAPPVGPEGVTVMPWLNLCQLPPEDLKAIYAFLRTVKPVFHSVDTHPGSPVTQSRPSFAAPKS